MEKDDGAAPHGPPHRTAPMSGAEMHASLLAEPVAGIRTYGTNYARRFPTAFDALTIGSDPSCDVPIADPSVSRLHARITRQGAHLVVADASSTNGSYIEGARRVTFQIVPGSHLAFGRVHLVVWSDRTEAVRARFQRLLGYGDEHQATVDHALYAATRRSHVVVMEPTGGGALALARLVHEAAPGNAWPLVVLDATPSTEAEQRSVLKQSKLGTLVVPLAHWPSRADHLRHALMAPSRNVRLVIVAPRSIEATDVARVLGDELLGEVGLLRVPSLRERGRVELTRLISELITEHGTAVGSASPVLQPAEVEALVAREWRRNYDELYDFMHRLVLIRTFGVVRAAQHLGVNASAISNWLTRHDLRA